MVGDGAYKGLRVLDLGQGVAAPYCAMLLAMHGAEVIKIEPLAGDWSRGLGRRYGDQTAMSASETSALWAAKVAMPLKPANPIIVIAIASAVQPEVTPAK